MTKRLCRSQRPAESQCAAISQPSMSMMTHEGCVRRCSATSSSVVTDTLTGMWSRRAEGWDGRGESFRGLRMRRVSSRLTSPPLPPAEVRCDRESLFRRTFSLRTAAAEGIGLEREDPACRSHPGGELQRSRHPRSRQRSRPRTRARRVSAGTPRLAVRNRRRTSGATRSSTRTGKPLSVRRTPRPRVAARSAVSRTGPRQHDESPLAEVLHQGDSRTGHFLIQRRRRRAHPVSGERVQKRARAAGPSRAECLSIG